MADGLLSSALGAIDRQKQAAKAGLGLLASNPQEWLTQTTARYLPTKAEEQQYRAVQQAGGDITQTPYYQKIFDLAQFQSSIKTPKVASGLQEFLEPSVVKQRVYHGTTSTDVARPEEAIAEFRGNRTWFSGNPEYANVYAGSETASHGIGGYVLPLNVQVTNPKIFPATQEGFSDWGKNSRSDRTLKAEGYDGVLFLDKEGNLRTGYAFSPNQLKSAIGNRGTYDVTNPNILAAGIPVGLLGSTQVELPKKQEKKPKK